MKKYLSVIVLFLLMSTAAFALDYDDYVVDNLVNDELCPLQIINWNAWYRAEDTITFGDSLLSSYSGNAPRVREAGFQYDLRIEHVGEIDIIAWQVNVVVFNAFGEYLDTFGIFQGAILAPEKDITRSNRVIFNGDSTFLTFFLWVDKLRDSDGNIYFADLAQIKATIDETMEFDLPKEHLEAGFVQEINASIRFRERQYIDVY